MSPVLPISLLIPLGLILVIYGTWASWRGSASLPNGKRGLLATLRLLALIGLVAILFNPGSWVQPKETRETPWLIMIDQSESMQRPLADDQSRLTRAHELAATATKIADRHDAPVRLHTFGTEPSQALKSIDELTTKTSAKGTKLSQSLQTLIDQSTAKGNRFAGILVLSDGRQTATSKPSEIERLSRTLRAQQSPLHAVAIGSDQPVRDLAVRATRPTITTFVGQKARIPFVVESTGLGALKPTVTLHAEDGSEIARQSLEIRDQSPAFSTFEVEVPEQPVRWTMKTDTLPNEDHPANNQANVNLRPLESKTRVFLAEGAPYWDSKFLAQLLRQQTHIDVHSVHRLSDERFFRIDSGDQDGTESETSTFPATLDELSRYDLIVFGKNIEAFLNPARLEALRTYVRERGGAVLFARGRPASTHLPALEALEPVAWARESSSEFRFSPSADGAAAGLFGDALPPPEASIWKSLPTLKDGRSIEFVKPFTRILAEGVNESSHSASGRFPALVVRRYGQGVSGLVNGDGLWKWDFYPEARELGNMYQDFWTQLIQWMASYSEFLPGQDFSLRLPNTKGLADESVPVTISFRGSNDPPQPTLQLTAPDGSTTDLTPAAHPGSQPVWRASFTPTSPGVWNLNVLDPRPDSPPTPQATFIVPAPAKESDDLRPDPAFLRELTNQSGGRFLDVANFENFLDSTMRPTPPTESSANAIWKSSWAIWPIAIALAAFLGFEWYLRRRHGLI